MFKLGLKEFQHSIAGNIFITIQLSVTLILTIAIVSSVVSRSRFYKPFEDVLSKNGVVVRMRTEPTLGMDITELNGIENVCAAYSAGGIFSMTGEPVFTGSNFPTALDDEYVKRLSPDMKSGVWLSQADYHEQGKIYGVITDNPTVKTGDIVPLGVLYYEESDVDFTDPIRDVVEIEIVGVIQDGSKILDVSRGWERTEFDFRNLYRDYNVVQDVEPVLFIPAAQLILPHTGTAGMTSYAIINFKDDITEQERKELISTLNSYGSVVDETTDINERSLNYIRSEMTKLLPLLICIFVLVVVSCVSICALSVSRNLRVYGIYYICGSRWNNCLLINLTNNIITSVLGIMLATVTINVIKTAGLLKNTVFDFGFWQFVFCAALIVLNLVISMIIPVVIMRKNTPKEILTENE